MRVGRFLALAAVLVVVTGCFRQVVQTGRTPSPTVIDLPWTNAFFWGLVAPAPIDVSTQCRSGIATVVTEQSFMNGLVSALTLGIYSPRHVTVTCATGSAGLPRDPRFFIAAGASAEERAVVFRRAAEESARLGLPVAVRF